MDDLIKIESHGPVTLLRMNAGPENRFNPDFVRALSENLDRLENDPSVKAAVITGAHPKYFCNGLDVQWMSTQNPQDLQPFLKTYLVMLHKFFVFPKPLVAAINGHAFAGGIFLALTADWRVMRSDKGWCCMPEIDLGFPLPPGHLAITAYAVGTRLAERICLTGERLTAQQALNMGLIDQAEPDEEVLPRALQKAEELGRKKQPDYRIIKLDYRRKAAKVLQDDAENFVLKYGAQ